MIKAIEINSTNEVNHYFYKTLNFIAAFLYISQCHSLYINRPHLSCQLPTRCTRSLNYYYINNKVHFRRLNMNVHLRKHVHTYTQAFVFYTRLIDWTINNYFALSGNKLRANTCKLHFYDATSDEGKLLQLNK